MRYLVKEEVRGQLPIIPLHLKGQATIGFGVINKASFTALGSKGASLFTLTHIFVMQFWKEYYNTKYSKEISY